MKKLIHCVQVILIFFCFSKDMIAQTSEVPQGSWTQAYDLDTAYLPKGFHCGQGWVQVATLDINHTGTATVIVDYIKIYEIKNDGSFFEVDNENYDDFDGELPDYKGGLFNRNPWGSGGVNHPSFEESAFVENGFLSLNISDHSNSVFHFWGNRFEAKPNTNYLVKLKCKIIGACALNVGLDWWRDINSQFIAPNMNNNQDLNNYQAFCSGWYGDTGGKFIEIVEKVNR